MKIKDLKCAECIHNGLCKIEDELKSIHTETQEKEQDAHFLAEIKCSAYKKQRNYAKQTANDM